MKYGFTLFFFICFCMSMQAQQPAQYSLYMFNRLNFNPAYAGLDHSLSFTGVYRNQWVGLEGNPTTQNVSAHMPLYLTSGGVGIHLENDATGARKYTAATLSYNYQKFIGESILSIGGSAGWAQRSIDGNSIRTPDGSYTDGDFNHQDINLFNTMEAASVTTFGAGIYFQNPSIEAGVSVLNITEPQLVIENLQLDLKRAFYFTLSGHLELTNSIAFHPSVLVRSDVVETQMDFSAIFQYNDNIFLGGAFRGYNNTSRDAVSILGGLKLSEKVTFGYAYDITISNLSTVQNGVHEILINYNLNKRIFGGRPPAIIYNPRAL
jgi:type IX secretion system PorP/SprF family membrane protein